MEPLLRAEDVMMLLGISRSGLDRLIASGEGPPSIRVGRLRRWPAAAVKEWIATKLATVDYKAPDVHT